MNAPLGTHRNRIGHPLGLLSMNRFLLLIACALAVFFISACAPIPDDMVPKDTYGSRSGTLYSQRHLPHRSARHKVRHATDHLLRPWNDLPAAPDTAATANIPTSSRTLVTSGAVERGDGSNAGGSSLRSVSSTIHSGGKRRRSGLSIIAHSLTRDCKPRRRSRPRF